MRCDAEGDWQGSRGASWFSATAKVGPAGAGCLDVSVRHSSIHLFISSSRWDRRDEAERRYLPSLDEWTHIVVLMAEVFTMPFYHQMGIRIVRGRQIPARRAALGCLSFLPWSQGSSAACGTAAGLLPMARNATSTIPEPWSSPTASRRRSRVVKAAQAASPSTSCSSDPRGREAPVVSGRAGLPRAHAFSPARLSARLPATGVSKTRQRPQSRSDR